MSKKLLSMPVPLPFLAPVLARLVVEDEDLEVADRVLLAGEASNDDAGGAESVSGAPMRTRMQCVGLLFRRQMKRAASSQPGMGVTMSGGV